MYDIIYEVMYLPIYVFRCVIFIIFKAAIACCPPTQQ